MPKSILLDELRQLMDEGVAVVEVLASDQYEKEHIPGATNIPLQEMNEHTTAHLDRKQPVVVYCFDYL